MKPRACSLLLAPLLAASIVTVAADDWPQWLGPQRDGIWREKGILDKFPSGGPPVKWRQPLGTGYAGPAVASGRLYVMDLVPGGEKSSQTERVWCLNEADGEPIWQRQHDCSYEGLSYRAGPRVTPAIHDGKVYTLGAVGHLNCFDAVTGRVLWTRDLRKDFGAPLPVWGFAGHPLIDGQKLICLVGGRGTTAMAFDKDTGKEIWRALSAKEPGYSPPVIFEAGGARQLIVWHPEALNSLDPETGKVHWSIPFVAKAGLTIGTPRKLGDRLFVSSFYNGSLMVKLHPDKPAATELWRGSSSSERRTDGLHCIICTPFLEDGHIYGACSYGQFRCLKADTGERLWETLTPTGGQEARWANAFIVKNGGRFFLWNEKGDLIIAELSPEGYREIDRAHLLDPLNGDPGRKVLWSHPAFANRRMYARNDAEIVCVSLAAAGEPGP